MILTRPVFVEDPDTKTLTKAPGSTSSEEMSANPAKEVTSGDRETEESSDGTVTSQTVPEGETNLANTDKQSPAEGEETPDSSEQQVWPLKLNFLNIHVYVSVENFLVCA